MSTHNVDNINVASQEILITPKQLKAKIPVSNRANQVISESRQVIQNILDGSDKRIFAVVGPCSIHDTEAAIDYAKRLKVLADKVADHVYIVMRVYFEKPRTTVGWKGLINDPHLNNSFQIEEGLHIGRQLLLDIAEIGLPTSTEALDPISPQYMQDLISWSAIGARTTESQTHREMSSGLSSPVGFKNGTDGGLTVATNALLSVSNPHRFLGINGEGQVAVIETTGNQYGHIVLRGGSKGPNYDSVNVKLCEEALTKAGLNSNIMIDLSHANSSKDHNRQPLVLDDVASQLNAGNTSIVGLMIESNIGAGNQSITDNKADLTYGVSVTDACIDWQTTDECISQFAGKVADILKHRQR
jgi:3-deoxy-7-phosphoheptulonate synthase